MYFSLAAEVVQLCTPQAGLRSGAGGLPCGLAGAVRAGWPVGDRQDVPKAGLVGCSCTEGRDARRPAMARTRPRRGKRQHGHNNQAC
jgi:hypothetical protein